VTFLFRNIDCDLFLITQPHKVSNGLSKSYVWLCYGLKFNVNAKNKLEIKSINILKIGCKAPIFNYNFKFSKINSKKITRTESTFSSCRLVLCTPHTPLRRYRLMSRLHRTSRHRRLPTENRRFLFRWHFQRFDDVFASIVDVWKCEMNIKCFLEKFPNR